MSWWTHVLGVVDVEVPGRTQAECRYIVDTVLEHLPLVTGSEGCMNAHAIQKDGHDFSSTHDEFSMRTNNLMDDYGERTRRYGFLQVQSHYMIVIEGSLRDRMFERTKRELIKWLCRLSKRLMVYNMSITLTSDDHKGLILTNKPAYSDMYEWEDGSRWTDYLMWEPDQDGCMPLKLVNKYYDDEEVRNELKRREEWMNK